MYKYRRLYEALELDPSKAISHAEIKKAHRRLVKKWHPDLVEESLLEEATEMMSKISHAWAILGDKDKRIQYDAHGIGEEAIPIETMSVKGVSLLHQLFQTLLLKPSAWKYSDIIQEAQNMINTSRYEVAAQLKTLQAEIDANTDVLSRLSMVKPNLTEEEEQLIGHQQASRFDPIGGMIRTKLVSMQNTYNNGKESMEELLICEQMLKHYKFQYVKRTDKAPPDILSRNDAAYLYEAAEAFYKNNR